MISPHRMSGDWSSDQPLRADATGVQIADRREWLMYHDTENRRPTDAVAREFAAACVVQCEEKLARAIAMNETLLAERNERDAAAEHQSALADLQSDAQLGRIVDMVASFTCTQPLGVRRFLGAMQMCGFVLTDVRQSLAPADWLNDGAVKAAREGIAAYVAARGSGPSLSHRMDTLCNAVASCGRGTEGEDTKRLNWLEQKRPDIICTQDADDVELWELYETAGFNARKPEIAIEGTLRAAIDAARSPEKPNE